MGKEELISGQSSGVFLSRTRLITWGVVVLVLLIMVIVLGALLGHTRSKLAAEGTAFP